VIKTYNFAVFFRILHVTAKKSVNSIGASYKYFKKKIKIRPEILNYY